MGSTQRSEIGWRLPRGRQDHRHDSTIPTTTQRTWVSEEEVALPTLTWRLLLDGDQRREREGIPHNPRNPCREKSQRLAGTIPASAVVGRNTSIATDGTDRLRDEDVLPIGQASMKNVGRIGPPVLPILWHHLSISEIFKTLLNGPFSCPSSPDPFGSLSTNADRVVRRL